jgi:hypothetical protein
MVGADGGEQPGEILARRGELLGHHGQLGRRRPCPCQRPVVGGGARPGGR